MAIGAAAQSLNTLYPASESTLRVLDRVVHELRAACLATTPASKESAFLEALGRTPTHVATREVYADWLEEVGRTREAAALRGTFEDSSGIDPFWWNRVILPRR